MIFKSFLFPSSSTTVSSLLSSSKLSIITKQHIEQRILDNINPYHLYNIIQDVNRYKEFIPYCTESKIIQYYNTANNDKQQQQQQQQQHVEQQQNQDKQQQHVQNEVQQQNENKFDAILTIGYSPFFTETYTSAVTCNQSLLTIEANSIQSTLFHSLHSKWKLYPIITPIMSTHNQQLQLSQSTNFQYHNQNQQQPFQQTKVHFEVSISTTDPIIGTTLDTVLQQIAEQQVIAFTKRCQQIPSTFYK